VFTLRVVHYGIMAIILLLASSFFPSWQQIYALQTGNTDKAFSVLFLYSAWEYIREHTSKETENKSSIINSSVQEPIDRSLILQGQTDNGTRLDPGDISEDEDMLTSELVTEELTTLNSTQIADYPLQELSSDEIIETFNILSDTDLQKVLGNTKPENLQIIFAKIPGELHDLILSRLDSSTKSYVESSIGGMLS
jgi:chromatin remodeling complex protein RSC6